MEYGISVLMVIGGILLYIKINVLQKQVKSQQIQIDNLCKETGNQQLATYFLQQLVPLPQKLSVITSFILVILTVID